MQWLPRSTHLCFRRSFDDVTRINFRFRLLVLRSSAHGRDASSCKIWCRYLYPVRSYWHFSEIQDGGRRHLGFSYYVNLSIQMCWQCGICVLYQIGLKYMHWLPRSMHLCFRCSFDDVMRINFRFPLLVTWSSAHGRDASSCKIGADIFIQCGVIDILPKLKMATAATHEGTLVVCTPCKNFVIIGSVVFKLYGFKIFVVQAWKSYSRPQNFSFGEFYP